MNCAEKFRRQLAGEGNKVEPAEVDGRAICNHPGCGKRLLGDGHCVDGHAQEGAGQSVAYYPEALDGLLCLAEQIEVQGQLYSDVPGIRQEQEALWQEARAYREQARQAAPSTAQYGEGRQLIARLRQEVLALGEPQLADDPRMQMARASIAEEDLIAVATAEMRARIDDGRITTAREADQAAADLAAEFVGDNDSADYTAVCAALCDIAGQEFPGEWDAEGEDEEDAVERGNRSCSFCGREKDGGPCIICDTFVCDQCQSATDDGPVCPNCVEAARKQGYAIYGEEEGMDEEWSDVETRVQAVGSMAREFATELGWSTTGLPRAGVETAERFGAALVKLPLLAASAALLQAAAAYEADEEQMPTQDSFFLPALVTAVAHAHKCRVAPDFPPLVAAEALLEKAGQASELGVSGENDAFTALRTALRAAEPGVRAEIGETGRLLRAYLGHTALTPDERAWAAEVAWDESPAAIRYALVRAIGRYRRMEQAGDAAAAWEWHWLPPEQKKAVLQWLTRTEHPLGKFPVLGNPEEWPQLPREPGGARAQAVFQRVIRALAVSESVSPDRLETLRRDPPPGEVPLIDLPDNVIEVDTRHRLVTDGFLRDVSLQAQNEWGYNWPVAVTRGVQATVDDIAPPFRGFQTPEARLNDVLMMARSAARRLGSVPLGDEVKERFQLILPTSESTDWDTWEEGVDEDVGLATLVIERNFASADDPRPCFTISLEDDY